MDLGSRSASALDPMRIARANRHSSLDSRVRNPSYHVMNSNWFVAWPVEIPQELVDAWQHDASVGIRMHHADDLHIPLAMLGRHESSQEEKLAKLLSRSAISTPEITLKAIVPLPQPRRFASLAWEIGNGRLELEKQILKWRPKLCREMGAAIEAAAPLPQLTFARPDRRVSVDERDGVLEWAEKASAPKEAFQLRKPAIYTFVIGDEGRQFRRIGEP